MNPIDRLAGWSVETYRAFVLSMRRPDVDHRPAGILECAACGVTVETGHGWYDVRTKEAVCDAPECAHELQAQNLY